MSLRETPLPTHVLPGEGRRRILLTGRHDLIRESVQELVSDGLEVVEEPNGHRAIERLCTELFHAAIIDLQLPPFDDFSVVSSWHLTDIPIMAITSKIDAADAIVALEIGADDYIRRSYLDVELKARMRALLRRAPSPLAQEEAGVISLGGLAIDPSAFKVWKSGEEVCLSVTEFKLLLALAREEGRVLTREALVRKAWGYDFLGSSRLVDMTIARLRSKIEERPKHPEFVLTVRGIGYLLRVPKLAPAQTPSISH